MGSIYTLPEDPSITIIESLCPSKFSNFKPMTQGIPRFLAIITVCEVGPAFSTIKPLTFLRFRDYVSVGVKSFAMMITSSSLTLS